MKLYYIKGACSLASHIVLHEAGADFSIEAYNKATGKTEKGVDFKEVNPKGYVPVLTTENGSSFTEGVAILQYIADTYPDAKLAPAYGTIDRYRLQEHLNYVSSELHKAYSPYFMPETSDAGKERAAKNITNKLNYVETLFSDGRDYLLGDTFSVADAYLFVVINWSNFIGFDLAPWTKIQAFMARVGARPSTQAALKAEGLAA